MANVTLITGNNGSNVLSGGPGADLIYGFDPNGVTVSSITATRVAAGLSQPLFATAPTGDFQHLFIVEKTGLIKILDLASGQIQSTPFLDVASQITASGECGLLGLAFDPGFASNGFFYVDLINTSGDTEIRRYHVSSANPNVADPASATAVISIDQPAGLFNHKAGWLGFGPDGDLYAALGSVSAGFDAEYYLYNNPDVRAAGVDPLTHFNTSGWREGRNPNLYFDTAGYLAHYADVKAAGVNPLQHYEYSGWHEGRDPSAAFDTQHYLAAYPDVAAANVNPLDHFLNSGIYEGRSPFSDGVWH